VYGYDRLPDPSYPQCTKCDGGSTVMPDGVEDYHKGWIFMQYDNFDPAVYNSASELLLLLLLHVYPASPPWPLLGPT
jgi:hypothetical protein